MIRLSDIERWRADESDRLRPSGQDPIDDHLEQQAAEQAAADRAHDHAPAITPPASANAEQPRAAHRSRCDCGAIEKGYRHPGHQVRCPRYSRHRQISDIR